ncbi:MAG: hypothetical protein E5Y67_29525 [Mesorhizobium sp.]|uniref:hypothetical protein n=1 Tax=Mesorhizobium sp. TaxID=1871066 RepID=UPI00122B2FD8|nr:hypothetical protein [Mesorhizobium sp.]TIM07753.1 MAG: hypothetical protein E5Y67_29525 [Mesorhizobium sp.]
MAGFVLFASIRHDHWPEDFITTLLNFFTGGGISFAVVGSAIVVILGFFWRLLYNARKIRHRSTVSEGTGVLCKTPSGIQDVFHNRELQQAINSAKPVSFPQN